MDRIKKLKIKKQDGTFSDYIPIGADAENIDFTNGYNLDQIVGNINPDEDGTLEIQLSKISDKVDKEEMKPNKNFDLKIGATINKGTAAPAGWKNALNNRFLKYFNSTIFGISITYDTNLNKVVIGDPDIAIEVAAFEDYIANGGICAGLKFHQSDQFKTWMDTYGAETICNQYATAVLDFVNSLSFKNEIKTIWILNEVGNPVMSATYKTAIINLISQIQNAGYKCSCPYANAYAITDSDQDIIAAQDFLSLNLYPFQDFYGEHTNIRNMIERFNKEFRIIERYLLDYDLYITESGCSSSWKSFNNPPAYYQEGEGRPLALWLIGLLNSDFIGWVKGIWIWYFHDFITWNGEMLLNIKNNREVYYGA